MRNLNRRNFLSSAILGGAAITAIPQIILSCSGKYVHNKIKLEKGNTLLFQGDSITDAGRTYNNNIPNNSGALGQGYVYLIAAELLEKYPNSDLNIFNKGISGDKVFQLSERWEKDCLSIQPDVLSIMIGVNDFWHTLSNDYDGTVETYSKDLEALVQRTKDRLSNVKLIICEPFALNTGAVNKSWFPYFDEYRTQAKKIAKQFNAIFVPFQSVFDEAIKIAPPDYWVPDGVHPSIAGAKLMAAAWLNEVFGI